MRIFLATLCLNEMEWLPQLYEQHCNWPGLVGWAFVEAADRVYAETNPYMVGAASGLSVDGTSAFLEELARKDDRVRYHPYGITEDDDPAQGKCAARSRYLRIADELEPDWIIVVDADEFYTKAGQRMILERIKRVSHTSVLLRQRHIWLPPSIRDEAPYECGLEVVGGYWAIPHTRIYRWSRGLKYIRNHNHPERPDGVMLDRAMKRYDTTDSAPQCVHMGFSSRGEGRKAKHDYYKKRGEGVTDTRAPYVECRSAWETWRPGVELPQGAKVIGYDGPVPEVFK